MAFLSIGFPFFLSRGNEGFGCVLCVLMVGGGCDEL